MSNILLTISLLISKRPDTVRKCLDSIQPLLRAVPSELILTDTGCGEEVRGIIEEYTDHIIDFVWCKDFSKARNAGLKQAKGQWFLFLDDDEWFEDTSEIIEFFNSGEYKNYGMAAYIQRNFLDKSGTVYTDLPVGRMVRLDPGIEFMYSIHECFNHVPGKVKKFTDYVHHYGYAYEREEDRIAHAMRNIELLLVEHANHPENMKHTLQLVQEYNSIERWRDSLELSLEGIEISKRGPIEIEFCRSSLYSNAVEAYVELNRAGEAITAGERYLEEEDLDPLARAMIAGVLAKVYIDKEMYEECLEKVGLFAGIYEQYKADADGFIGFVTTITSDVFEQRNRSAVLGSGVRAALAKEMPEQAHRWFAQMGLDGEKIFVSNEMIECIVKKLIEGHDEYREMCNTLFARPELRGFLAKVILDNCETAEDLQAFAGLDSDHWVIDWAEVLAGVADSEKVLQSLKYLPENMPYIKKCGLLERLEQAGYDGGMLLEHVPYYIWDGALVKYLASASTEDVEWWQQWVEQLQDSRLGRLRKLVWERYYYLRTLLWPGQKEWSEQEPEKIADTLWAYGAVMLELCERIYNPETYVENADILPVDFQVALKLAELQESMATGRHNDAVEIAKEVKELAPNWNGIVKYILLWIQKESQKKQNEQTEVLSEMEILGRQIKNKIRQLMQNGNTQEALTVAAQMEAMMPQDGELQIILRELRESEKEK